MSKRRADIARDRERLEDELYHQVIEGISIGALARERGLSRLRVYKSVERAAERESWRIAGLEPPRLGAVIFTLGKGGVCRAKEYDSNGDGHPIEVRLPEASEVGFSRPAIQDTTGRIRRREYPTKSMLPRGLGQQDELRRCEVCEYPIPEGRRAESPTCSDRCMNLRKRKLKGDPTARATIAWLRDPPVCEGCGLSLRDKRVGTSYHGARCRRKAASRRRGGNS
jgi:hypothetical protein